MPFIGFHSAMIQSGIAENYILYVNIDIYAVENKSTLNINLNHLWGHDK